MLVRSHSAPHRDVQRALALLMACDGFANTRIASEVGVAPMTVRAWRERFSEDGLKDFSSVRPGRGRKPSIPSAKVEEIVRLTLHETPAGETHWSCRSMASSGWRVGGDGAADLVGAGAGAASRRDVQAVKRSAVRGEARRRRRPVSEPAGEGGGAVRGREDTNAVGNFEFELLVARPVGRSLP